MDIHDLYIPGYKIDLNTYYVYSPAQVKGGFKKHLADQKDKKTQRSRVQVKRLRPKEKDKPRVRSALDFLDELIAKTFVHNPYGLDYVEHKDGDNANHAVANLRWAPKRRSYVMAKILQCSLDGSTVNEFDTWEGAAQKLGVSVKRIKGACRGNPLSEEFIWKREENKMMEFSSFLESELKKLQKKIPNFSKNTGYEKPFCKILKMKYVDSVGKRRYWDSKWRNLPIELKRGDSCWLNRLRYGEIHEAQVGVTDLSIVPYPKYAKMKTATCFIRVWKVGRIRDITLIETKFLLAEMGTDNSESARRAIEYGKEVKGRGHNPCLLEGVTINALRKRLPFIGIVINENGEEEELDGGEPSEPSKKE